MKNMRAIQFIKAMKGQGLSERGAEEILSVLDDREGELATKADLEQAEKRLEASIEQLREGQKRLEEGQKELGRSNRWAIGIILTAIILGFGLQDRRISDLKQHTHQPDEQQAERTGNSAKPAQEVRISAADHSGS